jgi:hypothetical protein
MKRILSVVFLIAAMAGMAYAFLKIAVVNGPFMLIVGISTLLTLMSGMLAGLGQGSANLYAAELKIKELTTTVCNLTDANDGIKATFDAKLEEAKNAFIAGYKAGPGAPAKSNRVILPTPAETDRIARA